MKMFRLIAALSAPLLLTGCLLSPGKFASSLDLKRDGSFAFTYVGEIVVTDLAPPAAEFSASPCYDDNSDERECSSEELVRQRKDFDESQAASKGEAGMLSSAMGGGKGGLGSDEGINELIEQLKKQEGWKKVSYRGNRIIDVEYAISGQMAHGFAFPLVDGGAAIMPFVTLIKRKDGSIKVSAPAYSGSGAGGEMASLGAMAAASGSGDKAPQPKPEGTFTLTTDGRILTNNTEDGPAVAAGVSTLKWVVNSRLDKGPEALIGLVGE
ncbi:hypothetical protein [Blastomonas sp. AAP53]|uniref:hypothetical protein n=1 Tax=Blastomonas sp. AAP53 TaxID=1248760 RepID=UPI0002D7EB7A|nr:hypothetical protein [Blastomonas sp. AAP53]